MEGRTSTTPRLLVMAATLTMLGVALAVGLAREAEAPEPPGATPSTAAGGREQPAATERWLEAEPAGARAESPAVVLYDAATVWIVDAHDRPVPGADVAWLPTDVGWQWYDRPWQDHQAEVRAAGLQAFADERGAVAIPQATCAIVVARDGNRSGQALLWFEQHPGRPTVRIAEDPTLRIVVVDAAGAPQPDIPVLVRYREGAEDAFFGWERAPRRHVGDSGADGTLDVTAVRSLRHWSPARIGIALQADVIDAEPTFVEVDLAAPPPLVQVPCPAHGWAVLHFRNRDGTPLQAAPRRIEALPFRIVEDVHLAWMSSADVRLGPLAPGSHWSLAPPLIASFAGPRSAGETVHVDVGLGEPDPGVAVRLLAPDGAVLANTEVRPGNAGSLGWRSSDADGWLFVREPWIVADRLQAGARTAGVQTGGNLQLQPLVATTGMLIDAETRVPLAGHVSHEPRDGDEITVFDGRSTGRRTFVLLSDQLGTLHLHASAPGFRPTTIDVPAGAHDLVVPLQRDACLSLSVRILIDRTLPASELVVRLIGPAVPDQHVFPRLLAPGVAEATWSHLGDAEHRFELRLAHGLAPLRAIDGLRPAAATPVAATVDLRGRLEAATFRVDLGQLWVHDGSRWGEWQPTRVLLLPRGAAWQGFVEGGPGLGVPFPIRPGHNVASFLPWPVLRLQCPGAGVTFDPEDVGIAVHRLRLDEPQLAAIAAQDRSAADEPAEPIDLAALTPDAVSSLTEVGAEHSIAELASAHWTIRQRGVYLVVPRLGGRPLPDQVMQVVVDGSTAVVAATVTIDPVRLMAARHEAARRAAGGDGR